MSHPYWPLFDLRVRTRRLELRYPDDELLTELASLAAQGIHPPDRMPFTEPWSRAPSGRLERNSLQYWWGRRASLQPDDWDIPFAVLDHGRAVGVQGLFAKDFAVRRSFETGSWLGRQHQGHGIGTEMRAAVLHFGFEGLHAVRAETAAFEDNPASQAVTQKLGYQANGEFLRACEGQPVTMQMFAMSRAAWQARRRPDIVIEGLDTCLPLLGLAATADA